MALRSVPTLAEFIDLVEASDPDAAHRLPLLSQAAPILYEGAACSADEGETLADRFERWRYQLLNNRGGNLSPSARDLADALDLAAGRARGCSRPPKDPRSALAAPLGAGDERVEAALDPHVPLDEVARWAAELTARHFPGSSAGARRRIVLYVPLYLSSFCINHCLYCAFRYPHPLEREQLDRVEALAQAEILRQRGFRHLLLVAGDFPKRTSTGYFVPIVRGLAARGFRIAIEIAPQSTASYAELVRAGACGVTLYQETYQEPLYARYHPRGTKAWFDWRLEGPERAAEAGMSRLGLGVLLGLADPRCDLRSLIGHGRYLAARFPEVQLTFSLPRIHEAPEDFAVPHPVGDETFIRLYCALRLAFPRAELVLSTRERPALRDRLAAICITQMSAGSSTSPGGYGAPVGDPRSRQQFPICDDRSAEEVADRLRREGFEVRWDFAGHDPSPAVPR